MTDVPKTFGSLFAGIGGIDLGLERCGLVCKWQVEIDPYCQKVLAKHWPNVPRHDDVKTFPPDESTTWQVDMVTAGFPCQDISLAGEGKGIHGNRSNLFFDAVRIARTLKARWIFLENVPAITNRGLDVVLATLSDSGFDAEWQMLSAEDVGAPHRRNRFWLRASLADAERSKRRARHSEKRHDQGAHHVHEERTKGAGHIGTRRQDVADASGIGLQGRATAGNGQPTRSGGKEGRATAGRTFETGADRSPWKIEPDVGRLVDGIPNRVAKLKALGNAVVPQCVENLCYQWGWNHDTKRTG